MPLDTIGILGGFNLRALGGHTDGSSMYVPHASVVASQFVFLGSKRSRPGGLLDCTSQPWIGGQHLMQIEGPMVISGNPRTLGEHIGLTQG